MRPFLPFLAVAVAAVAQAKGTYVATNCTNPEDGGMYRPGRLLSKNVP